MENEIEELTLEVYNPADLIVGNSNIFPPVRDLACLSQAAYNQTFGSKVIYDISESGVNEPIIKPLPDSWTLIATAQYRILSSSLSIGDGYNGAAYYNVRTKHLVIAHRGTQLSNLGSLWADIKGVIFSGYTSQMISAYKFTRLIVDRFWECAISISVTGHSLGGWLSQTSGFFLQYPHLAEEFEGTEGGHSLSVDIVSCVFNSSVKKHCYHLHVVVFDSPGASNIIEWHLLKHIPRYSDDRLVPAKYLNCLDVTTYFSSPNAINSTNMHIGSLFMMPNITDKKGTFAHWMDTIEFLKYTFDSHKMKNIVKFWQSDEFDEKTLLKVTDWPIGFEETNVHHKKVHTTLVNELTKTKFAAEPIDTNLVRMSIFDTDEREFLEDIHSLKLYGVIGENISWEAMFDKKDILNSTEAKKIFEFFDSFEIVDSQQVLRVDENRFKIDVFIRLVKYFISNNDLDLRKLVKEVISELPKIYQAIYRAFSTEYVKSIPDVQVNDFTALQEFLESSQLKVCQAVALQSTLICVAKILKALKSNAFSFGGNERLNVKQVLFLNSDLLTVLVRHVSISRIVPPKDGLKLILIENSTDLMTSTLKSLIAKVLDITSPLIKLILVTSKKVNLENYFQMNFSPYYLESEMRESDQEVLFDDLIKPDMILESEICFQGADMQLKNLVSLEELQSNPDALDQSTLVSLLSQTSKIYLGGAVNTLSKFERSYYIPRHFYKIVLTEPNQLLMSLRGKKFVLVISYDGIDARDRILSFIFRKSGEDDAAFEWQENFNGFVPEQHKVILVEYTTRSPNHSTFRSFFETMNLSGLWLVYDTNKWYWQLTFGKQNMQNFRVSYDERYNEKEMLQLQRPLVIVSDEPGMGKSTLLKNFAEECSAAGRDTGKASWVIFVNLESSKDLLSEGAAKPLSKISGCKDIGTVIDFLSQIDGCSSVGTCLFKYFLQQDGRVTIFFDGLDEVTVEIQTKVFNIAKTLLDHTKAKVFIASRLHLRSSLESYFSSYINKFLPLTEPERINFLTNYWTNHPDFLKYDETANSIDLVHSYASRLLKELQVSLNIMQADSFIGVPLQLFMLGNVSLPHVCSFISKVQSIGHHSADSIPQEHMVIFGNIFNLYQTFVGEKCRISLEEKSKLTQLSEHYPWHNRQLIRALIELHRISSFFLLFPNEFEAFKCSDIILDQAEVQVLLGVGIVHSGSIDLSSIQFIHRSLAEYFAADFLVSRLATPHLKDKAIDFLRKNMFLPQFDKIRFFVDHFISIQPECDTIFRKCLDWEKEKVNILTMLADAGDKEVFDLLGRNVLHYAICYGDHNNGILWFLIQNQHLFSKTDVFDCGFLSYAVLLPNLSQFQLHVPWVTFEHFCQCFHPNLLKPELPDLNWMIWFSGQRVNRLNKLLQSHTAIAARSEFEQEIVAGQTFFDARQIEKFSEVIRTGPTTLPTDLNVAAMRGDSESIRPSSVQIFVDYMIEYVRSPEKYLQTFKIAMTMSSAAHVKVALQVYEKIKDRNIARQMLDLLALNNFSLFKNCIDFISEESVIESHLWLHCKKQQKEIFDIATTKKFITLRRALQIMNNRTEVRSLVDGFFQIYEKIENENIRKEMIDIVRDNNYVVFESAFRHQQFASDLIWKCLPIVDKEQVLEKHYDTLNECVITKIRPDSSPKLAKFLSTICYSVGSKWQNRIENDVKVDLKAYKKKTFLQRLF